MAYVVSHPSALNAHRRRYKLVLQEDLCLSTDKEALALPTMVDMGGCQNYGPFLDP